MKKLVLFSAAAGLFATVVAYSPALAVDNVGTCGWGSKLFEGDEGVAPQVLAVTTNGVSGNQTFAISSATSGCTRSGTVRSNWKTVMFIDANREQLAQEFSQGGGESVATLASLIGVEDADKGAFAQMGQAQFAKLFPREDVAADEVVASLRDVLSHDARLARYSSNV